MISSFPLRFSALLAGLLTACPTAPAPEPDLHSAPFGAGRLTVAVSIPPQAWLAERLGGDLVEVQVLMPAGASPATYELSPRQVVALDHARLYLAVGHPDFPFEQRLLDRWVAHREDLTVVTMTAELGPLAFAGHGHDPPGTAGSTGAEIDPHIWVAPETMAAVAEPVSRALVALDPEHATTYRRRLESLLAEIAALDRELRTAFADLPRRRFWVYHPAWGYLARQYGLEQVAMEAGGKELSAARLVALIDRAREEEVSVVFVQRGFSERAARALATEAGARVEVLDPLARDWPANLRQVASRLRAAMGGTGAPSARLR